MQIRSLTSFLWQNNKTVKYCVTGCTQTGWLSFCSFTLKRSKLFFRSLGLRSPWRQTQENWWPLLSGPKARAQRNYKSCIDYFLLCIYDVCVAMSPLLNLNSTDSSYLLLAGWSTVPCCHSRSWCDRRLWPGPSYALWWPSLCTRPSALWWLLTTFLKCTHTNFCYQGLIHDVGRKIPICHLFLFMSHLNSVLRHI